jgi:hypothetical protein
VPDCAASQSGQLFDVLISNVLRSHLDTLWECVRGIGDVYMLESEELLYLIDTFNRH